VPSCEVRKTNPDLRIVEDLRLAPSAGMSAGIDLGTVVNQLMPNRMISTELTVGRGENSSRSFALRKREDIFPDFLGLGLSRIQRSGFIIPRPEHRASLLRRPREEDPSGDQLDSSYDRSREDDGGLCDHGRTSW
jgi:hypothetical protein